MGFNFDRAHVVSQVVQVNKTHVWIYSRECGCISVPIANLKFVVVGPVRCNTRHVLFDTDEPISKRADGEDHTKVAIKVSRGLIVAENRRRLWDLLDSQGVKPPGFLTQRQGASER